MLKHYTRFLLTWENAACFQLPRGTYTLMLLGWSSGHLESKSTPQFSRIHLMVAPPLPHQTLSRVLSLTPGQVDAMANRVLDYFEEAHKTIDMTPEARSLFLAYQVSWNAQAAVRREHEQGAGRLGTAAWAPGDFSRSKSGVRGNHWRCKLGSLGPRTCVLRVATLCERTGTCACRQRCKPRRLLQT